MKYRKIGNVGEKILASPAECPECKALWNQGEYLDLCPVCDGGAIYKPLSRSNSMEAKVDEKEKKKKKENDERDTNEPEVKTLLQREFTVSSVPYTESNEEEPKTHWEEVSVKSLISCHSAPPEFWKAIDVKDLTAVKEYVEDNFSLVAAIDEYGERALHRCIYVNALEIVELLIDKGADLHIINIHTGATPLHRASTVGKLDMVKLLLSKGANPNARMFNGITALHSAITGDYVEIARELLLKKARKETLACDSFSAFDLMISPEMKHLLKSF